MLPVVAVPLVREASDIFAILAGNAMAAWPKTIVVQFDRITTKRDRRSQLRRQKIEDIRLGHVRHWQDDFGARRQIGSNQSGIKGFAILPDPILPPTRGVRLINHADGVLGDVRSGKGNE